MYLALRSFDAKQVRTVRYTLWGRFLAPVRLSTITYTYAFHSHLRVRSDTQQATAFARSNQALRITPIKSTDMARLHDRPVSRWRLSLEAFRRWTIGWRSMTAVRACFVLLESLYHHEPNLYIGQPSTMELHRIHRIGHKSAAHRLNAKGCRKAQHHDFNQAASGGRCAKSRVHCLDQLSSQHHIRSIMLKSR